MLQGVWPFLNIVNVCKTFSPDLLTWYNKLSFLPEKQSSLFPRLKKMFNVCIPNVGKERYWYYMKGFPPLLAVQVDRSHSANYLFFLTSVSLDILLKMYIIIMSLIYNAAVPKMLPCFVKITISKGWEKEKIKSCVLI